MTHLHIFHLHNAVNELTRLDLDDIQEVREITKHTDTRQELDQPEFLYTEVHLKSGGVIKAVKDLVLDIDRWIKEISPGPEPMYTNVCAHGCVICAPCNYIPEGWKPQ